MTQSIMELALELTRSGTPYALATVVWCARPTSAKPGAQALIQADGKIRGWIGGSCTQPIAIREAKRLLMSGGEPVLLKLGGPGSNQREPLSDQATNSSDVRYFPMTCASGGALDIFIEPYLPQPRLLLIGDSPVNAALSQLAPVLDFNVIQTEETRLENSLLNENTFVLIATHGQYDEDTLAQVLPAPVAYVGMVSSPRRADACRAYLRSTGLPEEQIARLKAPAGLDLGAREPAEIAASILAELIQLRRQHKQLTSGTDVPANSLTPPDQTQPVTVAQEAIDPVCGMTVEIAGARHTSEYAGQTYYFCCPACQREFVRQPEKYLVQESL